MRAGSSFSKKKISLFLGAGPSNVTLSPPQSITGGRSAAEKPIDEENFKTSNTSFHVKSEVSGRDTLTTSFHVKAGGLLFRYLILQTNLADRFRKLWELMFKM